MNLFPYTARSLRDHDPESYKALIYLHKECMIRENNKVIQGNNGNSIEFPLFRDWSMVSFAMKSFLGVSNSTSKLPVCKNSEKIIESVKHKSSSLTCVVPWLSPYDMCSILSKFIYVEFAGDSILRHTYLAFLMLLKGDLRFGAITQGHAYIYKHSSCDGQFSEYKVTRQMSRVYNFTFENDNLLCAGVGNFSSPTFYFLADTKRMNNMSQCSKMCSESKLLRLIIINGGIHYQFNSHHFISTIENVYMAKIKNIVKLCKYNILPYIRIVVFGSTASSKVVLKIYPYQKPSNVIEFNLKMKEFLKSLSSNITYIDTFELSQEAAEGRSSDGVHFISDFNSMRVMTLVNIMSEL